MPLHHEIGCFLFTHVHVKISSSTKDLHRSLFPFSAEDVNEDLMWRYRRNQVEEYHRVLLKGLLLYNENTHKK